MFCEEFEPVRELLGQNKREELEAKSRELGRILLSLQNRPEPELAHQRAEAERELARIEQKLIQ